MDAELLVYGFVRRSFDLYIPMELKNICLSWYRKFDDVNELHMELEIDPDHAFQDQVITTCIAKAMKLQPTEIVFDGINETVNYLGEYLVLFCAHIVTTRHEIENLVQVFYNSVETRDLHKKIAKHSGIKNPIIEIRELYETDPDEEQMDEFMHVPMLPKKIGDFKEALKQFIDDTDMQFDELLNLCKNKIINE